MTTQLLNITDNIDTVLFKYKQALKKSTTRFSTKSTFFINKNTSYLASHNDLKDVHSILQTLTVDIHRDTTELNTLKTAIHTAEIDLSIEHSSLMNSSLYDLHKV